MAKMRQVVVDNNFQSKGLGSKLVLFTETYLSEQDYESVYCHARDVARNFYLKLNYEC